MKQNPQFCMHIYLHILRLQPLGKVPQFPKLISWSLTNPSRNLEKSSTLLRNGKFFKDFADPDPVAD